MTPQEFIARLVTMFGEPKTDDVGVFLDEYARVLSGFEPHILAEAIKRVIDNETFWPRPAELRKHALAVAERLQADKRRQSFINDKIAQRRTLSDEERARHDVLMASFHEFMRDHATGSFEERTRLADTTRPAFERMQRTSPNRGLHTLTEVSKRMTGERE